MARHGFSGACAAGRGIILIVLLVVSAGGVHGACCGASESNVMDCGALSGDQSACTSSPAGCSWTDDTACPTPSGPGGGDDGTCPTTNIGVPPGQGDNIGEACTCPGFQAAGGDAECQAGWYCYGGDATNPDAMCFPDTCMMDFNTLSPCRCGSVFPGAVCQPGQQCSSATNTCTSASFACLTATYFSAGSNCQTPVPGPLSSPVAVAVSSNAGETGCHGVSQGQDNFPAGWPTPAFFDLKSCSAGGATVSTGCSAGCGTCQFQDLTLSNGCNQAVGGGPYDIWITSSCGGSASAAECALVTTSTNPSPPPPPPSQTAQTSSGASFSVSRARPATAAVWAAVVAMVGAAALAGY